MNEHILFVMRNLDNPELFTQAEKEVNRKSAHAAYSAAAYATEWAAYAAVAAAVAAAEAAAAAAAAAEAAAAAAVAAAEAAAAAAAAIAAAAAAAAEGDAEYWINEFFERSGEDKQTYINEVERLKEPWHTLAGETPEKDKRMEMTQDNFYRVLAMNDELIHQQKDEIAKLKQTVNKLRMRELDYDRTNLNNVL